jgi:GH35 family endo-1,4-beta-xylanase
MQRRYFLYVAGSSLVALQSDRCLQSTYAFIKTDQSIEIRAFFPHGELFPKDSLKRLYFLTLQDEPLPSPEYSVEDGLLVCRAPSRLPVSIALQFHVDGFGNITLYADNQGQGFTPGDFPVVLNQAFARDRIHRVTRTLFQWQAQGYRFPEMIHQRLEKAQTLFQQGEESNTLTAKIRFWNDSLSQALWAGEELSLSRARQRIVGSEPRHGFKFGCNAFAHPSSGPDYDRYFEALFNYATVPFYWNSFEPEPGSPGFDQVDQQINWLQNAGITPKGHPLVWFHQASVPDWIRDRPYGAVKAALRQRILDITRYYEDRILYYDVINEAHGVPWANELGYDDEQLLDLTRMACNAAKQGNPKLQRIINNCCLWARQVALNGPPIRSPFQYMQACQEANISFEIIGLQLYYPHQDIFEIDRMLDRFTVFGKPIHITEMAVSSNTGTDEDSLLGKAYGLWHAPWNETIQADWAEQVYTLAYSKPEIEAVTWWDFSDNNTFWPFGGLLNDENQPKLAYYRLQTLLQSWGLG